MLAHKFAPLVCVEGSGEALLHGAGDGTIVERSHVCGVGRVLTSGLDLDLVEVLGQRVEELVDEVLRGVARASHLEAHSVETHILRGRGGLEPAPGVQKATVHLESGDARVARAWVRQGCEQAIALASQKGREAAGWPEGRRQ